MAIILAIDDKVDNLVVVQAILKQSMPEAQVLRAESGEKGLEIAKRERPDVILLDIIMPGMDGYETCRRLRADPVTENIPVVMLTAVHTDSLGRTKALESGADAFLTKPIESSELVAQIRAMLRIKEAEDKLRGERSLMAEAVVQTTDMVIITDRNMRVIYTNPAYEKYSGYSGEDIQGQEIPLLSDGEAHPGLQEAILDSLGRGEAWTGSLLDKRKDGENFDAEATFIPIRSDGGGVLGYLMIERDVSKRNHMEQQLRQAQKMEALGTLAGGIAHDFNNVLSVILGYAELTALDLAPDSELAGYMNEVMQAGQRARELIGQILTFSRNRKQKKTPLQLKGIVKEVQKMLKASLPATITVEADVCGEGVINADPTQMHQVVMNLCTNAFHAMQEHGGVLRMTLYDIMNNAAPAALQSKGERFIHLSISDTGEGMPPELLERIFEPYFTTKKAGEGTGLGLSIVHSIITDLGGLIQVDSKQGQGTKFDIYLPIYAGGAKLEDNKLVYLPRHKHAKLLLVDDELPLVRMNCRLLTRLGYQVKSFTDPLEAIKYFETVDDAFDVLITDLTMPNMNGLLLSRTLRKRRPDLHVMLVSGFFDRVEKEDIAAAGIDLALNKPVGADELAKGIDECLDKPKREC